MKKYLLSGLMMSFLFVATLSAQTYVGSDKCKTCHDNVNSNLGYNIYQEYIKTGHPYKLNPVNGSAPVYPANTSPGVPVTPTGTTWDDFSYVIGGYGWKARYVKKDGRVWTDDETAQYNLETGGTVAYHLGEEKLYNQGCFKCHTTGATTDGSWNGVPGDSLGTFSEPGIRCEGCHGPGSDHAANPTGVKPPNTATALQWDACANCHNRGGISNSIPQSGLYIRHHEQSNEVLASKHGQKSFTCATCHDAHVAVRYPDAAGAGLSGITTKCATCHPSHDVTINGVVKSIDCVDCHMAPATKSAVGMQKGNGWRGDVKTHIMAINTEPVPRDSMFDGGSVKLDANGLAAVTLDFACLRCHENEDLEWASSYAKGIHTNGITTGDYVGDGTCMICHNDVNKNVGYNIYEEYKKTGHPYKLNPVNGAPPVYPANTSEGVPVTPTGTTWDDFAYVIGGYGWKARYVKKDGRVWTVDETAQYNLETKGTVAYHLGEEKLYNQGCFKCHTTGATTEGSWNGVPADSLGTFAQPGVRCEGCHGPGKSHIADPANNTFANTGTDLQWTVCASCHNRGGVSTSIPASGLYIRHHEQSNEVLASKHGQKSFTCATCHDAHIAVRYPDAAGEGLSGITTECSTCHANHDVKINGIVKSIDCVDCHMAPATKSAVGMQKGNGWRGDVKTHIMAINTDAVPRDSMFAGGSVKLDANNLAAVTLDFACLRCHENETLEWASGYAKGIHTNGITTGDYVGDGTCMICHNEVNTNLGYNIYEEYKKTGHPYKLNPVNGAPPVYPENTTAGVPVTPTGTTWDDFAYVIGGYGWKARYVKKDGRVWTVDTTAQYNLETQGTVAYHLGEEKLYNQGCFKCHTTGATTEGSWNGVPADSLGTFAQPGVRCEGCHGPGKDHIGNPTGVHPSNTGTALQWDICASCHNRGGISNAIPVSGGYIRHHEQSNEVLSSKHGQMNFTCASCHDAHIPLRYEKAAGEGLAAIKTECETCHSGKEVTVNGKTKPIGCVDCHMPPASKSAVGMQVGNGWRGDIPTHIFKINTAAVTKDAMWSADGKTVALDNNGIAAVTMDFACLRCHTSEDVAWAATYADSIHQKGIVTGIEEEGELPTQFNLAQNYPNPFNPTTTINFELPKSAQVALNVYDVNGQLVLELVNDMMPAGYHSVEFDASMLASGIYIYSIKANKFVTSKKMVLLK